MALQLRKPSISPVTMVIAGEQGLGKTTLASLLPSPVLIPVEDGTSSLSEMDIDIFDQPKNTTDVHQYIKDLATSEHDFKTLIIDSTTAYDAMIVKEIQARNNTSNLSACDGGFGGGYHSVRSEHEKLRAYCDRLRREKGMNIVFISHTDVEEITPPDSEPYTRYTIQCTKSKSVDTSKVYTNDADVVAFVKLKTLAMDGRAKSDGSRIITCYPHAAHVSKNRFDITKDLPFEKGVNPFDGIVKQLTKGN